VPIPRQAIHEIPAEAGAATGAARHAETVAACVPFDLVLLGVGEDGHTASLFPEAALTGDAWTVGVLAAPKPPPARVSLGLRALRATARIGVLATGTGKRPALQAWQAGVPLPVIRVCSGRAGWMLADRAAAG
jgi:6-phosphogluconolactonase